MIIMHEEHQHDALHDGEHGGLRRGGTAGRERGAAPEPSGTLWITSTKTLK